MASFYEHLQNKTNGQDSDTDIELEIEDPKIRQYVYMQPNDILNLWKIIQEELKSIKSKQYQMNQIVESIKKIIIAHFPHKKAIQTQILSEYLDSLSMKRLQFYQNELIPFMAKVALDIGVVFQQEPINLLLSDEKGKQQFTKYQVAVLICNMFFCTLHQQEDKDSFPLCFDFSKLYMKGTVDQLNNLKKEKLKFLFNYFEQVYHKQINWDLCVSFERVNYPYGSKPSVLELKKADITEKSEVIVNSDMQIEQGINLIQVTFANKLVGGGVLNKGALQEEIRYLISPECLVGIILFSELQDNEAIIIQGAQQVSDYEGYGYDLKYKGPYNDDKLVPQEKNNMLNVVIVGMDAIDFSKLDQESEKVEQNSQYEQTNVLREIAKAFTAFRCIDILKETGNKQGIITGNWGCGDFQGDKELKFLIQWIAASWCRREPLYYCTYNDELLKAKIEEIYQYLKSSEYSLFQILQFVNSYNNRIKLYNSDISLFEYLCLFIN